MGATVFNQRIITLPISYSNICSVTMGLKNIPETINIRADITSTSQITFTRTSSKNVTGWYMAIGY